MYKLSATAIFVHSSLNLDAGVFEHGRDDLLPIRLQQLHQLIERIHRRAAKASLVVRDVLGVNSQMIPNFFLA